MKLRMSPELKDQVEAAAKESGRSMNAEIVHRLSSSFEESLPSSGDVDLERLQMALMEVKIICLEEKIDLAPAQVAKVTAEIYKRLSEDPGLEETFSKYKVTIEPTTKSA